METYFINPKASRSIKNFGKQEFSMLLLSIMVAILLSFLIVHSVKATLILLLTSLLLILIIKKPESGILLIVVLLSSIVFEEALPTIPIGIGALQMPDIILIYLILRSFLSPKKKVQGRDYVRNFLFLFYLASIISLFNGLLISKVEFSYAVGAMRTITYYLLYFVIINFIKTRKQILFMYYGILIIGIVVGIAMLVQAGLGRSLQIMPGRIEFSQMFDSTTIGVSRILPPGQTLIYASFIWSLITITLIEKDRNKFLLWMALLACGAGILLTFNRNFWFAGFATLVMFLIFVKNRFKGKFLFKIILPFSIVLLLCITFAIIHPSGIFGRYIVSIKDRFTSLFDIAQVYDSGSIQNRKEETQDIIKSIRANPIFGIGLGATYRDIKVPERKALESYCHNGYLSVFNKMGIIGFVPFLGFFFTFLSKSLRSIPHINTDFLRSLVVGSSLFVICVMISNIVNPMVVEKKSIVVLAIVMGLSEVASRLGIHECIGEG